MNLGAFLNSVYELSFSCNKSFSLSFYYERVYLASCVLLGLDVVLRTLRGFI